LRSALATRRSRTPTTRSTTTCRAPTTAPGAGAPGVHRAR
jgi:hypothetical protein